MSRSTLQIVSIAYLSFNVFITLIVSIIGAIYVKRELNIKKKSYDHGRLQMPLLSVQTQHIVSIPIQEESTNQYDADDQTHQSYTVEPYQTTQYKKTDMNVQAEKISKMNFMKLWFKLSWKLRSVYLSLAVHAFDTLTDILVIIQWWNMEDHVNIANINSRDMAACAIATLIFHKMISTLAFWIKDHTGYRCILQVLDLLIFEEIYMTHKTIIAQFRKQSNELKQGGNNAIETSTSFKYIRSLEAVFESMPQSVLQLVFIIRTGKQYKMQAFILSLLSIFQSMVSMTNSIIMNDNLYMNAPIFNQHKKKLPPSLPFLKHMLCRLSEVFYRIILLSLFWTVVGGSSFAILLGAESFALIVFTLLEICNRGIQSVSVDDIFLRIQTLVTMPSELVFAYKIDAMNVEDAPTCDLVLYQYRNHGCCAGLCRFCIGLCWTGFCCYWPSIWLSRLCCLRKVHYWNPDFRIGTSLMEWTILIIYAAFINNEEFLFSVHNGFALFIFGFLCFIIYTQYMALLPNFAVPMGYSIRSKWGYAFSGDMEELSRLHDKFTISVLTFVNKKYGFQTTLSNIGHDETYFLDDKLTSVIASRIVAKAIKELNQEKNWSISDMHAITEGNNVKVSLRKKDVNSITLSFAERFQLYDYILDFSKRQSVYDSLFPEELLVEEKTQLEKKITTQLEKKIKTQLEKEMKTQLKKAMQTQSAHTQLEKTQLEKKITTQLEKKIKTQLEKEKKTQLEVLMESLKTRIVYDLLVIDNKFSNPWDKEPFCAMFAMVNGHDHIVNWLENEKRATKHRIKLNKIAKSSPIRMSDAQLAQLYFDAHNTNDYFFDGSVIF
eukprot:418484_1